MKLLPQLVKKVHLFRFKIIGILFLLIALPIALATFAPKPHSTKETKPIYYASELTMRSKKTEFKPTEKPTFKINIGKLSTQKTSMLDRFLASVGLRSIAFAQEDTLPELKIEANRAFRETDQIEMVAKRSGSDEIEVSVADVRSFRPGKYKMTITSGNRNIEQDFSWGVLAVNTNKSIYSAGETAKIGMAVLDDLGRTKCLQSETKEQEAKIWLTITTPSGEKKDFTTENGSITGSSECADQSVTNEADFQTQLALTTTGVYQMHMEAQNQNGRRTIDDFFEVKDNQSISIERSSLPTRIYPLANYTNTITVTTSGSFKGVIKEIVPSSFEVTCENCQISGGVSRDEFFDAETTRHITWNVDWGPGNHTLTYSFNPPNISPEFYLLGPMEVIAAPSSSRPHLNPLSEGEEEQGDVVYREARYWQIASDATKTWVGAGADNNWNTTANWSPTGAPATTSNIVFDGTTGANPNKDSTINANGSITDMTINGYSGTITQAAVVATSGVNGITITSGTLTGGTQTVTLTDGSITINGGTYSTTTGVITLQRNFTYSSGTLTNNGTIAFTASTNVDDATLTCSTTLAGTWRLDKTTGADFTLSSGCTVSMTESVASLIGHLTNHGDLTLTGGSSVFSVVDNQVDNDGSLTIDSGTTLQMERNMDNTGGTLTNNGDLSFVDSTNVDDSTFTCSNTVGGTVNVNKTAGSDFTLSSGCTITSATASSGASGVLAFTINGSLTLTSGTLLVKDGDITVGSLGTFAVGASAAVNAERDINSSGTITNAGTISLIDTTNLDDAAFTCSNTVGGTVNINKTAGSDFSLSSGCTITNATASSGASGVLAFTINGSLTLSSGTLLVKDGNVTIGSSGTLDISSGAVINAERNWTESSGSVTTNSGTINFIDTTSLDTNTWTCGTASNLGTVVVNKSSSGSVTLSGNCTVGNFTRTTGNFNNPGTTSVLTVTGNFSMSAASTFGGSNLTISMGGSGTQTIAQNAGTFSPAFKVNKTGGSASLTTSFAVATLNCTIEEGTFDIAGQTFTCGGTFTVENGGNFQLRGSETPPTPTLDSGSKVTYTGTGSGNTYTLKNWPYYHLTINGSGNTFQPNFAMTGGSNDIDGDLTVTAGTFDVVSGSNYQVDVAGSFSNAGTFLAQAGTLKVGDDFTNNGTFTKGTGTVELNTATTSVVNGSGSPAVTFNNLTVTTAGKTVQFTAGITVQVDGALTITGTSGNEVVIESTSGSQWFINHQGTEAVTYADITNSGCDGSSTDIDLTGGTNINGGNNGVCWVFVGGTLTVSGNIYTDEGSTAYDCSANTITVHVSVNGSANADGNCTLNTGAFSIAAALPSSPGDPVVIFIDSGESIKATTITLANNTTSPITSQKLYTNHVVLTHESAGPITNSKLATGDNSDAGIRYSVSSSNLTTESGMELYVYNSKTYSPGGTITTQGSGGDLQLGNSASATIDTGSNTIAQDILINTSATLTMNADTAVNGGDITNTGILTTTANTPTLTISGTGTIGGGSGAITVHNLTTTGSGTTTFSGSGTNTINNNVSVGSGTTLNINASIGIAGNLTTTSTGVINTTSGTPTVTVSGTSIGGGNGNITFYNLTKSSGSTATLSGGGTNTISNNLSVTAGGLIQSNALTVTNTVAVSTGATLTTNANLTINGGALTTAGTGIVNTTANTPTTTISGTGSIGGGGSVTLYNLTTSSGTTTLASETNINNTLTVNNTLTGSSNLTVTADFVGTGTVTLTGTTENRVASNQNFGTSSGSNAWSFTTLIFSNSSASDRTVTTQTGGSGTVTVSTLLQVGKGGDTDNTVLDAGNRTWTISGTSGTPFTITQGSLTPATSTFTYTGNNGSGNTTLANTSYYNLVVNNGSETFNAAASPLTINAALTVTAGTLDLQTNSMTVGSTSVTNSGGISVAGTLTQSAGGTTTVRTSASGTATIGGAGTKTFYSLTIAPTAASGTITLGSAGSQTITVNNNLTIGDGSNTVTVTANTNNPILDVNGNVTINASGTLVAPPSASFTIAGNMTSSGTFTHNSGTVTFDTTTTATLAGSSSPAITFYNVTIATSDKTVLFTSGQTFRTNGLLTVTGTSGHPVTIDATSNGAQWSMNHQGTENVTYAAIQDSGCDGSSTNITQDTTNANNGNNGACWIFTMDVSGNIYTDEGSTAYNCSSDNLTIHLSVNGGANLNATCTLSTGAFTFTNVPQPSIDTPFVVFIDSTETPKATTVGLVGSSSISSLKLYQNRVIVSHEGSTPITNAHLATADNADSGIRYSVSSSNLTTESGMALFVYNGKTYNPGGTVTTNTTGGDFKLGTSATATLGTATNAIGADMIVSTGATLTINADTTVGGGDITTTGTLTTSSGTPTITVRGTGTIGSSGSTTVYNLAIGDGTTATSTLGSDITITNDMSVANGSSVALASKNVSIAGGDMSTTGTGAITCSACSAGTVTISSTGNIGGGGAVTVYNLTSSSGTQTLASTTTALNTVTVNGTLTGSSNLTLSGAFAGTGTVTLTGTTEQRVAANQNFGTTSGSNAWSFATLIFSNSSGGSKTVTTQTGGSGGVTASTLLQIGKGGDSAGTVLDAGNRTWTVSGTSGTPFTIPQGSLTASTSTFAYTGNNSGGNTTLANVTYNNLTCNNGSETFNAGASPLNVDGNLTITAGTLDLQTNSLNVGSTSVTNSGNITNSGTLTQSSSGTTTIKTSASGNASIGGSGTTTFYNLALAPTAAGGTLTLGTSGSQTMTITNNLTIGDGSNSVIVTGNTNNPALDVNGSFTINSSGTFVAAPTAAFTIAGNMTNNGTFTANGGTVTFDTTSTATLAGSGSPAIRFYRIASTTSGKTLRFTAGQTFQIDGLMTFADISIDSTTSSQWFVNHQGVESVSNITLTNSGCDGASTDISLITSTNGGNNGACWLFAGTFIQGRLNGTVRLNGNTRFQ